MLTDGTAPREGPMRAARALVELVEGIGLGDEEEDSATLPGARRQ